MPFIDILIFAVIAVLLVLRLRSVLGQRTGYEEPQDNQAKEGFADKPNAPIPFPKVADKTAKISGSGIDVLRQADRQFNEKDFIQGATAAFNMILIAFAEGDQAQLKRLLSYDLLQSFMQTIHDRTAAKETLEITVDEIREVSILNVELVESVAAITVHFHTMQTRIARDEHGRSWTTAIPSHGNSSISGPLNATSRWLIQTGNWLKQNRLTTIADNRLK